MNTVLARKLKLFRLEALLSGNPFGSTVKTYNHGIAFNLHRFVDGAFGTYALYTVCLVESKKREALAVARSW